MAWHHIKTTEALQAKKTNEKKIVGTKSDSWWNPHQGSQIFNVYLVSAGQVQRLDSRKATNG